MVGIVLAPMIADIKRVSQLFQGFKSTDMLELYVTTRLTCRYDSTGCTQSILISNSSSWLQVQRIWACLA